MKSRGSPARLPVLLPTQKLLLNSSMRLIIGDTIGQSAEAADGVSAGHLHSALLSHVLKPGKIDLDLSIEVLERLAQKRRGRKVCVPNCLSYFSKLG